MKTAINVEFTDDELIKYASDVGRRWGLNFIHDVIGHLGALKIDPKFVEGLMQAIKMSFEQRPKNGSGPQQRQEPQTSQVPHADPFARGAPPDPHDGMPMSKCLHIESSSVHEEGWACHLCGTYNIVQRPICRACQHERCDVIAPPPPGPRGPSTEQVADFGPTAA